MFEAYIKLFWIIPFFKLVQKNNKIEIYLFDRIPLLKIKWHKNIRANNDTYVTLEMLSDLDIYKDALAIETDNKTILLVEPILRFHSECLPSYIKYCNDLGYRVHVLLGNESIKLNSFSRLKQLNYKLFGFNTYESMVALLNNPNYTNKYKKIIITTSLTLRGNFIGNELNLNEKFHFIIHSIQTISDYHLNEMKNKEKLSVLSYFNDNNLLTINPHYYGDIIKTDKNKDIVHFISIGRIDKNVKNYSILKDSVLSLIKLGYKNFKIHIVGYSGILNIEPEIQNYIIFHGELNFPDLYKLLENCDYILSLLDPNNKQHFLYTNDLVTGTNQLCLGFIKPCIINEVYAKAYSYTEENAIIYKNNDLSYGMAKAICLNDEDYKKLQDGIEILSQRLTQVSKCNLQKIIEK